jgi:hypothetical protein
MVLSAESLYRKVMAVAALVFTLATVALAAGVELVATWYYSLAWWSYILFADAALAGKRGKGVLLGNRDAPALLLGSIAIWVSFEIYNLRLANWRYLDLPAPLALRWLGYGVAFATVLPAILVTAEWMERLAPERPGRGFRLGRNPRWLAGGSGFLASLLPWIAPDYFFPLVWLGPTAFFAALNHRLSKTGILTELESRGPGKLYRLLAAGAVCGLLWELWNFWAQSKWVYQIPFFDRWRLFEMPLAGYLGFPPFAVECREMYLFGRSLLGRLPAGAAVSLAVGAAVVAYALAAFWAIDRFTVLRFAG